MIGITIHLNELHELYNDLSIVVSFWRIMAETISPLVNTTEVISAIKKPARHKAERVVFMS